MQRVTIDPITRLEGHGKIDLFLDDQGNLANAYLVVPELRGFEKFAEGRPVEGNHCAGFGQRADYLAPRKQAGCESMQQEEYGLSLACDLVVYFDPLNFKEQAVCIGQLPGGQSQVHKDAIRLKDAILLSDPSQLAEIAANQARASRWAGESAGRFTPPSAVAPMEAKALKSACKRPGLILREVAISLLTSDKRSVSQNGR